MRNVFAVLSALSLLAACSASNPPPDVAQGIDVFKCQAHVLLPYVESIPQAEALLRRVLAGQADLRKIVADVHAVERALKACAPGGADAGVE